VTSLYLTGRALGDARFTPLVEGTLPGWKTIGLSRESKAPCMIIERQLAGEPE
jgi:hypothetical protein